MSNRVEDLDLGPNRVRILNALFLGSPRVETIAELCALTVRDLRLRRGVGEAMVEAIREALLKRCLYLKGDEAWFNDETWRNPHACVVVKARGETIEDDLRFVAIASRQYGEYSRLIGLTTEGEVWEFDPQDDGWRPLPMKRLKAK